MQVTASRDHITHVTLGGLDPISVTASDSAEFYHVLSSALYKNPRLAMIREVLCNAWDAHLASGCSHKPISIFLTKEELIIRDYGNGIAHSKFGQIYGVYGGSTKQHDGVQTGGFGLGCKSPWAYVEHFEVQSCHEGTRTIYNLAKSSAETMGKPSIIPIASFPAEDSGVQVKIQLKSPNDYQIFDKYIRRIVANGGIYALMNYAQLAVLPWAEMEHDFLISTYTFLDNSAERILLRYGNVVYPIESAELSAQNLSLYKQISSWLSECVRNSEAKIVFQAPPNRIGVMPSREGLSMAQRTQDTIHEMFSAFKTNIVNKTDSLLRQRAQASIRQALEDKVITYFLSNNSSHLYKTDFGVKRIGSTMSGVNLDNVVDDMLYHGVPEYNDFRKEERERRFKALRESGWFDKSIVNSLLDAIATEESSKNRNHNGLISPVQYWVNRHIRRPLGKTMVKYPRLRASKLMQAGYAKNLFSHSEAMQMLEAPIYAGNRERYLPMVRRVFILTFSKNGTVDRARSIPPIPGSKNVTGLYSVGPFAAYVVPRHRAHLDEARAYMRDLQAKGWECYDFTIRNSWEPNADLTTLEEEEEARRETMARKREEAKKNPPPKARPGFTVASSILKTVSREGEDGTITAVHQILWGQMQSQRFNDKDERSETAEFFIDPPTSGMIENSQIHAAVTGSTSRMFLRMFASRGVIANSQAEVRKLRKLGVPHVLEWAPKAIAEAVMTNPRLREYWANEPDRAIDVVEKFDGELEDYEREAVNLVYNFRELLQKFGIEDNRTPEDKLLMSLFDAWPHAAWTTTAEDGTKTANGFLEARKVNEYLASIKQKVASTKLVRACRGNVLLSMMNVDAIAKFMNLPADKPERAEAFNLLVRTLRG